MFARGPDEFGVGVAHLILTQPAAAELVDEVATRQTVIHHGTVAAQRTDTERHAGKGYPSSATCHGPRATLCA